MPSNQRARRFAAGMLIAVMLAGVVPVAAADEAKPPAQPTFGPGGSAYSYQNVVASRHGDPPTGFWLFTPGAPADEATELDPLPVVVFIHGFSAVDPAVYQGWIDHIVRRGSVVIYPDYQTLNPFSLRPEEYLQNTFTGVRDAVALLETSTIVDVDLSRFAVLGHSVGGVLTSSYAALATEAGVPAPIAIMPVEPGGCDGCGGPGGLGMRYPDLSTIAPETRVLMVVGESDWVVGDGGAREAWEGMSHIPTDHRDYMVIRDDDYGSPALEADHFMPQTGSLGGEADALDWLGLWKSFDLLLACAFDGDCAGMNGSAEQLDMGSWSDGTPVRQPLVTDTP